MPDLLPRNATELLIHSVPVRLLPCSQRALQPPNVSVLFDAILTVLFWGGHRLVKDILGDLPNDLPDEARTYIKKMCDHTCQGRTL